MAYYTKRPKWPYDEWTFEQHKEEKNEEHGGTEEAQTDSVEVNSSQTEDNTLKTEHEMVNKTLSALDDNLTGAPSDARTEYKEEVNKPLLWTDAPDAHISEACPIKTLIRAPSDATTEYKEVVNKPLHWTHALDADISKASPINTLIRAPRDATTEYKEVVNKPLQWTDALDADISEASPINTLLRAPLDATTEYKEVVNKPLHWTDALDADISEACPINTLIRAPRDATTEYKEVVNKPLHWTDALDADISEECPINTLIRATALPNASETAEAQQMKDVLMPMMEATLKELTDSYKLFKGSRLHLVGSMAENTKVGKADEFDFAVILPVLAQKDCLKLVDDDYEKDPKVVLHLLKEYCVFVMEDDKHNLQRALKKLWSMIMMKHVPEGWQVLNPDGHRYSRSVAETFHLQHQKDNTMVNLDVCFWIPLDKESLLESKFTLKRYQAQNCLDENGLLYLILPQERIHLYFIRLAMSGFEKHALNKYGADNGRLQCYRTCKCLVSALMPDIQKKKECDFCFDGLVSSYCLKNIVLYMAENHTNDDFWTREKLPNRVLEVFIILTRCMNNGCVFAYFTPNKRITIDPTPKDLHVEYEQEGACVNYSDTGFKRVLPDLSQIREHFIEDPISQLAVAAYEWFLGSSMWRYPDVICRVTELLTNLMQEDKEARGRLVKKTWLE